MIDNYKRNINYMRISITDRCNLRCRYCMPNDIELMSMEEILTYEDIYFMAGEAVKLGINRFKITGGEPLVRRDCISFIQHMKQIPGVEQVTLTTNGILLKESMDALVQTGIDCINVSLDTLIPEKYHYITGFDRLQDVLEGIRLTLESGLRLKINCVLQKGFNEDEWYEIASMAQKQPIDIRFIEMMPIGEGDAEKGISNTLLIDELIKRHPDLQQDQSIHGNGPAVYYKIPGWMGSIGFISAIHRKFCDACNRIRMTSTGDIKPCLCFDDAFSVKKALRNRDQEETSRILNMAISKKPKMHCFEERMEITEQKKMVQIGG